MHGPPQVSPPVIDRRCRLGHVLVDVPPVPRVPLEAIDYILKLVPNLGRPSRHRWDKRCQSQYCNKIPTIGTFSFIATYSTKGKPGDTEWYFEELKLGQQEPRHRRLDQK